MKKQILCIIPARGGSKRIHGKNIRKFCGKPLIAYTIQQAKQCLFCDRIIVDTDSLEIAKIAKRYGAEVPYIRPSKLSHDKAQVTKAITHLLNQLKKDQNYEPTHIMILQTTSPLRQLQDIYNCWNLVEKTNATTVLTVCATHPRLYYIDKKQNIILANILTSQSTNTQEYRQAYILNGCFVYIVSVPSFLKKGSLLTQNTKAIICEKWRSVDLDTPEDWVLAEILYKNKNSITSRIKKINSLT